MQAIRSAILGAGFIASVHARAVAATGGQVAWVAASTEGEAGKLAGSYPGARPTTDWRDAIEDADVDLVHVCTPNHLHVEIAAAALQAGKHVICEKPLSTDVTSAAALTQLATNTDVVSAVPFTYRFYPTVRDARARLIRGDLGDVRLIHGSYLQDWLSRPTDGNWRVDPTQGGASRAFADIGVHWCDLAEFVTGQRIVRLNAQVFTIDRLSGRPASEDGATVIFETDLGVQGSVVISQVSPGRKNRLWLSVDGSEASAQFDQENPDSLWLGTRGANSVIPRGAEGSTPEADAYNVVPVGHPMGFQDCFNGLLRDVHSAIHGEAVDGLPTFSDGLRAAVVTQAVLESARTKEWVEVPR